MKKCLQGGAGFRRRRPLLAISLLALAACTKSGTDAGPPKLAGPTELAAKGRAVYSANCIACHNTDPAKAGSLGPEISGASHELLEARVLRGQYPEGYKPKRTTHVMPPLPHLKNEIDALEAFLKGK